MLILSVIFAQYGGRLPGLLLVSKNERIIAAVRITLCKLDHS
jgi:hypothetical protein